MAAFPIRWFRFPTFRRRRDPSLLSGLRFAPARRKASPTTWLKDKITVGLAYLVAAPGAFPIVKELSTDHGNGLQHRQCYHDGNLCQAPYATGGIPLDDRNNRLAILSSLALQTDRQRRGRSPCLRRLRPRCQCPLPGRQPRPNRRHRSSAAIPGSSRVTPTGTPVRRR